MPVGKSAVSPRLTRLVNQRGVNQKFLFPNITGVQVGTRDGHFMTYDAGAFLGEAAAPNSTEGIRPIKGKYESFDFGSSKTEFELKEYYAYFKNDVAQGEYSDGMSIFEKALPATGKRHDIVRERDLKSVVFSTDNWTNGAMPAAGKFDSNTSNPVKTIRARFTQIAKSSAATDGERWMIMDPLGYDHLRAHAMFTGVVGDGEITNYATHEMLADAFDVDPSRLLVGKGVYNEERLGETASNAFIWSDYYLWMGYMPASVDESAMTALAYLYLKANEKTVKTGENETGDEHYRWMRATSVGKYQVGDTAGAYLYTATHSG